MRASNQLQVLVQVVSGGFLSAPGLPTSGLLRAAPSFLRSRFIWPGASGPGAPVVFPFAKRGTGTVE